MAAPKRIALFLDGTWNDVDDNTNVWRLKSLCSEDVDQVCYYSKGVGTAYGQALIGGMFGLGLDAEVIGAYQWLITQYKPQDKIFIFGFSRGAYTARSLAGFISKCGLLKPGAPLSLKQLYARYGEGTTARTIRQIANLPKGDLSLEEQWLKEYSMAIPVWFQGVWDTVGALGIPFGHFPVVSRSDYSFLEVDLRINEDRAFHAIAIDEHREAFQPTLWTKTVTANADTFALRPVGEVEQRWFVGAHADVGGGYNDGLLAQVPLKWLMDKAILHGLKFNDTVIVDGDEALAEIHDSFAEMADGLYHAVKFGRPYYRPIGELPVVSGANTTSVINETIDLSVFDRWRSDPAYRPNNLVDWAARHGADISKLQTSIRADDPSIAVASDQITAGAQ